MPVERILLVHNFYQQAGGEDVVFASEKNLLLAHGHEVVEYTDYNSRLDGMSQLSVAENIIWSNTSYRSIKELIRNTRPDIAHFHNTFLMISPSAYYACHEEGVPIVQTLHNYRLLCPAATFYRNSRVCEECLESVFLLPGIYHSCYRDSMLQTAGISAMVSLHKILGTWNNLVSAYIALTDFSRQKFIQGGLPEAKIVVKPNFVTPDPGFDNTEGDFALFVGRLSGEKGILTLLKAWKLLLSPPPLKIIGDGPLRGEVLQFIENNSIEVEYLGLVDHAQVITLMKEAYFLVFPSEWYEGFPMVIAEALACGLPIICSQLGAMAEILQDKVTGIFFAYGDANDLAEKVVWAVNHPIEMHQMRLDTRTTYLTNYSEEMAYKNILQIYKTVLGLQ